jgi:hypothetical protein
MPDHRTRWALVALLAATLLVATGARAAVTEPPFDGTIFIDPDIITSADPSTLASVKYAGRGKRSVFDRRKDDFTTIRAYLFTVKFNDGLRAEAQVNPEFGKRAAAAKARKYARVAGRLPKALRADVKTLWIHKGNELFGGGNASLLIHTAQADIYEQGGILEEALAHEAAHTSLDVDHATAPGWRAAQAADPTFISTYARDNPVREDIAESFVPYFAVRYRRDRITPELAAQIEAAIPNRLAYFDAQGFSLGPLTRAGRGAWPPAVR